MLKINAIGDVCPIPVIKTKKALKENDVIEITVDNEIATQNLKKMALQQDYSYDMQKISEVEYIVAIDKNGAGVAVQKIIQTDDQASTGYTAVVDSNTMGRGNEELGKTLLKGFIYALTEQDVLPEKIIFYNGGAHFVTKDSENLEDLQRMAEEGVEIYVCGACVDFYGIKDEVAMGEITNMYRIVEMMRESQKIVKP